MDKTYVGPERERVTLTPLENDAFTLIVESSTYAVERLQLSNAILKVRHRQGKVVTDAFQGRLRRAWRPGVGS